ncbi:MAG: hypothetical protein ACE5HN_01320 [Nitrospiria bacterium]
MAIKMMVKTGLVLFLLMSFPVVGLALPPNGIEGKPSPEGLIEGNIDDVAKVVVTYFPRITGKVVGVEGGAVSVDVGGREGVSKGVLLTAYREGEPFYHPVTGVLLGRFEDEIGLIEVARSDGDYLRGDAIKSTGVIQVGDLVRIPVTRIPLAVSISTDSQPFLMEELVSALGETGRFHVDRLPMQSAVEDAFKRNNRYLIQLATSRLGERFLMNLQIHNTVSGSQLAKMNVLINQSEESDLILEHLQYQLFEERQNHAEPLKR